MNERLLGRYWEVGSVHNMVDWFAISGLLSEKHTLPVVLLDAQGGVRVFNSAAERALGRSREQVLSRSFVDLFVPETAASLVRANLSQALGGELDCFECPALTSRGGGHSVKLAAQAVGKPEQRGILLTMPGRTITLPSASQATAAVETDLSYEIETDAADFGRIQSISTSNGSLVPNIGDKCYQVIHRRESPCEDCPVRGKTVASGPRTAVRRRDDQVHGFEVVTATSPDSQTALLHARVIEDHVLSAVQNEKIKVTAKNARLTERERAIFESLLRGGALAEIATELGVTPRTVRFHQGNVLRKLGVDSRADLVSLLKF